jgi:hypothetical protein
MVKSELRLDYTEVKKLAESYDNGDKTYQNLVAKTIWAAYETGFCDGVDSAEQNFRNMNILMFAEAGNA